MNRKTMVLTAAAGLLAPALSACGSASGGGAGTGAIVVGTTDRFEAADYAPAPSTPPTPTTPAPGTYCARPSRR